MIFLPGSISRTTMRPQRVRTAFTMAWSVGAVPRIVGRSVLAVVVLVVVVVIARREGEAQWSVRHAVEEEGVG